VRPSASERAAGQACYEVTFDGWVLQVRVEPAVQADLRDRAGRAASATHAHVRQVVRAQIPGRVVRLWVAVGQQVEAGERLLAVEAMKMENEVRAPRAGTVESIGASLGATVELGDELAAIG
jgi:biotin carboxyl carrier protein